MKFTIKKYKQETYKNIKHTKVSYMSELKTD